MGALLRYGWTLNERQVRDARHIIAARVTGALFFVTDEDILCAWINLYRTYMGGLQCISWRGGECGESQHRGHSQGKG